MVNLLMFQSVSDFEIRRAVGQTADEAPLGTEFIKPACVFN